MGFDFKRFVVAGPHGVRHVWRHRLKHLRGKESVVVFKGFSSLQPVL